MHYTDITQEIFQRVDTSGYDWLIIKTCMQQCIKIIPGISIDAIWPYLTIIGLVAYYAWRELSSLVVVMAVRYYFLAFCIKTLCTLGIIIVLSFEAINNAAST